MATVAGLKTGQARRLYASATAESTFGTAATISHIFEHMMESSHLDVTKDVIRGGGWTSGVNTDVETNHLTSGYSLKGSLALPASEVSIPIFLSKCMGSGDTKGGSAGAYTHALTWTATPNYLPGMTLENHIATATADASYDKKHSGVCIDSFKFSFGKTGFASLSLGILGSGITGAAADPTESGLTKPIAYVTAPMCRVLIEACATAGTTTWDGTSEVGTTAGTWGTADSGATDISAYIESFEFEVANNGSQERQAGLGSATGLYAGQVMPGNRAVSVGMTVLQGTPFDAVFRSLSSDSSHTAQGEYMISLAIASATANNGGMITFPLCTLKENPSGGTGSGVMKYTYNFAARATYTGTSYAPIVAYFVNTENIDYL